VHKLADGELSVRGITTSFAMRQPAISKHLREFEAAGLVTPDIDKQRRPVRLNKEPMAAATWLNKFKTSGWNELINSMPHSRR